LGEPVRLGFHAELDQLRLQVELMAVRVDQNLERMRDVVRTGDVALADQAANADDDIDAMNISLTERCYDVLVREAPVASELRFVVSVLRVLSDLERIGDLALRVVKLAPHHETIAANEAIFDILLAMTDEAVERFRVALRAWATLDLSLATELATAPHCMDVFYERLMAELLRLHGPDAVRVAIYTDVAGRSLDRVVDHATIIGARVRYLITGDPNHLATEVR
jgi:phosphate transport system protein